MYDWLLFHVLSHALLPGVLPEQEPWLISGKGKDPSTWITWSAQEMRGPWPTVSKTISEDTTAATVRTRALFAIMLARNRQVTVIKVSHCLLYEAEVLVPASLPSAAEDTHPCSFCWCLEALVHDKRASSDSRVQGHEWMYKTWSSLEPSPFSPPQPFLNHASSGCNDTKALLVLFLVF